MRHVGRSLHRGWLLAVVLSGPGLCLAQGGRGLAGVVTAPDGSAVGKQWLLVVGIDKYQTFPDLRCCVRDARAVRDVCRERYLFDHVLELYNADATRQAIVGKLRQLAQETQPADSVLIYYAGHGHQDELLGTGFWLPHDATRNDATWVANTYIRNYLRANVMKAKHVLLVSDSCFSGDFFSEARVVPEITDAYHRRAYAKTSRQAVTSGGLEPVADGPFAVFFTRALRENQRPYMTPSAIFERIKEGVALSTARQTPMIGHIRGTGSEMGEFIFFLKQQGAVHVPPKADMSKWQREQEELKRLKAEAERRKQLHGAKQAFDIAKQYDNAEYVDAKRKAEKWGDYLRDFGRTGHEVSYARERLRHWQSYRPSVRVPTPSSPSGKTWTKPKDGSVMVSVPAGTFKMGSNEQGVEKPIHDVHVAAFYIGKQEVTNRQFKKFVDANWQWRKGRIERKYHDGDYLKHWNGDSYPSDKAEHPVEYVSWFAANAYCEWAGGRLPTEAEWEKACRAGSNTKYCFGESESKLGEYAWNGDNSNRSTHPAGQKKPNQWGIHDMHGNVWEWCSSLQKSYPYKAADGREDMNDSGSDRVVRGGSWFGNGRYFSWFGDDGCRSAHREDVRPAGCLRNVGFRVASSARAPR